MKNAAIFALLMIAAPAFAQDAKVDVAVAKRQKPVVSDDYVNAIHEAYPQEIMKGEIQFEREDGKTRLVQWKAKIPVPASDEEAKAAVPKAPEQRVADRIQELEDRLRALEAKAP